VGLSRPSVPRSRLPLYRRLLADPGLVRRCLLVLVLATLTAAVTGRTVQSAEAARRSWGETREVLVTRHDVKAGDPLMGTYRRTEMPIALAPPSALRSLPSDARAAAALDRGSTLTPASLDDGPGQSDGRRRVAVAVTGAPLPVEPGGRVDLWATVDPAVSGRRLTTVRVARDAVVTSAQARSVVVAVEPDEVADVAEAVALATVTVVGT